MKSVGVYLIRNMTNGKVYIGSTIDYRKRQLSHLSALRRGVHANRHLQSSFSQYSEQAFQFELVEACSIDELQDREQVWIDKFRASGETYNLFATAYSVSGKNHPMYGHSHTEEAKEKIRLARSKQAIVHSSETREKIGLGHKGVAADPEHIRKMVAARQGKVWNKGVTAEDNPRLANKFKISLAPEVAIAIVAQYQAGVSINSLSREFNCGWEIVKRTLQAEGVKTRTISQQKRLMRSSAAKQRRTA